MQSKCQNLDLIFRSHQIILNLIPNNSLYICFNLWCFSKLIGISIVTKKNHFTFDLRSSCYLLSFICFCSPSIQLQLMKDLVEKVSSLLMSQVKSTRVDQKAAEIQARAYLRAADISTPPGSSIGNFGAQLSGVTSGRTSVCSSSVASVLPASSLSSRQFVNQLIYLSVFLLHD